MINLKSLSLVALLACFVQAQDDGADKPAKPEGEKTDKARPDRARGGERGRRMDPLLQAIDADKDRTISAEEIKGCSKALLSLDKDKDGMLSREECGARAPSGDRGGRMASLDKNKDGKISKDEAGERVWKRLATFDKNEDGVIDKEEMKAITSRGRERGERKPEGDKPKGDKPEGEDRARPERPEGARQGRGDMRRRGGGGSPMMRALDKDRNQELSVQEIENAPEALLTLDKNKDGKIAGDEIMGGRRGGRASMMERFDANGDGKIAKDEATGRFADFFDRLDADGDGFITQEEIDEMRRGMGGGRGGRGGRGGGDR